MVFRITHIKECLSLKIPPQSRNLFHFSILVVLYKMVIFHCLKRFMNLTLLVSINVDWILVSVSCFSGDSLFAIAFARGWISELCCPCDLSTFNLQTKTMHIWWDEHLSWQFLAIFLNIDSTHVIWFGKTWIKFLAFASCAMYIVCLSLTSLGSHDMKTPQRTNN
jgi:hypothetical protein